MSYWPAGAKAAFDNEAVWQNRWETWCEQCHERLAMGWIERVMSSPDLYPSVMRDATNALGAHIEEDNTLAVWLTAWATSCEPERYKEFSDYRDDEWDRWGRTWHEKGDGD